MHKSLAIVFLGVALIVTGMVTADANTTASGVKIGFVDLERTLRETAAGKRAQKQLEASRKKKENELNKKAQELEKYRVELQKQATVLKPDVLQERGAKLQQDLVKLQERYAELQRDLAVEEAKLVSGILKKAEPVLKKLAREQGYTMIVDRKAVLWWGNDALDLTDEINAQIK